LNGIEGQKQIDPKVGGVTMTEEILFIQVQGNPKIIELPLPAKRTEAELHSAVAKLLAEEGLRIFIDEMEDEVRRDREVVEPRIKHGTRIHVTRHERIEVTVHYLEKTAERRFGPGTRVRTVKDWAAREFHISPKDSAEHVLQLCNSKERPPSDTPLHALARGCGAAVCFDLVPEKRVEG
jgi:hypothetical protein